MINQFNNSATSSPTSIVDHAYDSKTTPLFGLIVAEAIGGVVDAIVEVGRVCDDVDTLVVAETTKMPSITHCILFRQRWSMSRDSRDHK